MHWEETAHMVVQAAQTGHLVLSTLHTNDSAGAIARLLDLEVEPFLIASSLAGVLAQRLVRRICQNCAEAYQPGSQEIKEMGLNPGAAYTFYKGRGCELCMYSGYQGRVGLFELLLVDDAVRALITQRADAVTIRHCAAKSGMVGLKADGAQKVVQGITTAEEVARVTQGSMAY